MTATISILGRNQLNVVFLNLSNNRESLAYDDSNLHWYARVIYLLRLSIIVALPLLGCLPLLVFPPLLELTSRCDDKLFFSRIHRRFVSVDSFRY